MQRHRGSTDAADDCERVSPAALGDDDEPIPNRRSLTDTDESANGVASQVAPSGAAKADDYLEEETE
jgi:hypothetical protein